MEPNNDKNSFTFSYSAAQQAEIQKIREKYEEREEGAMEQLRRLDAGVTKKAQIVSLSVGILGTLILGLGMSFIMSDLGAILGEGEYLAVLIGIIVGIVGAVLLCLAYPLYSFVLKKERARIAPVILRLTDELLK